MPPHGLRKALSDLPYYETEWSVNLSKVALNSALSIALHHHMVV